MKHLTRLLLFSALVGLLIALGTTLVLAQDPPANDVTADEVNQVARSLNCPTCQSLNLADCRTVTCEQWRDQVADLLAEGYTDEEVLEWFVARFGDEVLQEPPKRGFGLLAWVLPLAGVLLGAVWLFVVLRKWSASTAPVAVAAAETPGSDDMDDDYLRRVEQDIDNL